MKLGIGHRRKRNVRCGRELASERASGWLNVSNQNRFVDKFIDICFVSTTIIVNSTECAESQSIFRFWERMNKTKKKRTENKRLRD